MPAWLQVQMFYMKLMGDPLLRPFFEHIDMPTLVSKQVRACTYTYIPYMYGCLCRLIR